MDVEAKVVEIIVQQLGVDADKVKIEASFVDDLGAGLGPADAGVGSDVRRRAHVGAGDDRREADIGRWVRRGIRPPGW